MNSDCFRVLRQRLMEKLDLVRELSDEEILEEIDDLLLNGTQEEALSLREKIALRQELFYSVRKLDVLQELIDDNTVTEIMVNGPDHIFVERAGKLRKWEKGFTSREKLEDVIQQIVGRCNRVINESMPICDARLENGARVNAIVNELRGEKIDIITWDENPAILIQNALSPAKVISVIADADEKSAKVVVPDYQLSLAIGKEGQNARLAARLTGFKIDIKSETQARESGDFMDYENDYEEDDYDDDYDYSDDELAENERLADTEQADVQTEALDTEADENEAAGTENDAADSGDEQ